MELEVREIYNKAKYKGRTWMKKKRNIQHILFHQMKLDKIEKSHLDSYEQERNEEKQ